MDLEHINSWAKLKGINLLGTGDFTHPLWFKELEEKLIEAEDGIYRLKDDLKNPVFFVLTTEISCIYKKNGKTRRIHLIIFAPDLETVRKINLRLGKSFNLVSDGRPILGLDAKELLKIILDVSPDCFMVPAHIYTPWYSLFGSNSGFDSIEECFEDYAKYIFTGETGLSSIPSMSWLISSLDKIILISNSDAHSPENLGREVNVFEFEKLNYENLILAMKTGENFKLTIEFFPEEGKYHLDGHRSCNLSLSPEETKKYQGICPVCKRPLTIGVLHRVIDLADREKPIKPKRAPLFKELIPLKEIIAQALGVGKNSKKVEDEYLKLIKKTGSNEFSLLLDFKEEDFLKATSERIAQGVVKMRRGEVEKKAGYDGVYGEIKILFDEKKRQKLF